MIASLGDILWSVLVIFFMLMYLMMLFQVVSDLFRDSETSGLSKALWIVFLLVLPLIGLLFYVILRGESMTKRNIKAMADTKADMDQYIRDAAGGGAAAEIERAKALLDSGAISQDEFEALKRKALS